MEEHRRKAQQQRRGQLEFLHLGRKPSRRKSTFTSSGSDPFQLGRDTSPVGSAVARLLELHSKWIGTPTDLYNELTNLAGNQAKSKAWPLSAKGMRNAFTRLAPSFRRVGILIQQKSADNRAYTISKCPSEAPLQGALQPPEPPIRLKPSNHAGLSQAVSDVHPPGSGGYPPDVPATACLSAGQKPSKHAASGGSGGSGGYSGPCTSDTVEVSV